ncbi:hypothetical protein ACFSLT_25835 [Novosphingobium resinovorum]
MPRHIIVWVERIIRRAICAAGTWSSAVNRSCTRGRGDRVAIRAPIASPDWTRRGTMRERLKARIPSTKST